MSIGSRLRQARIKAGYPSASAAAAAFGWTPSTYASHENGQTEFPPIDALERYARAFQVPAPLLIFDLAELMRMKPIVQIGTTKRDSIPIMGVVAAGSSVLPVEDAAGAGVIDDILLPENGRIAALLVKGDSMYPRFMDGETLLYDPKPVPPGQMIGQYAVVQTLDGRMLIKKIKGRARQDDHWTIWSHNADDEDVQILTCFKAIGLLL